MKKKILGYLIFLLLLASVCLAANELHKYPILGTVSFHSQTYKEIDDYRLQALVFSPSNLQTDDQRPVMLFFHGGGWSEGNASTMTWICRYFASRGWVAITFQYRLCSPISETTPIECIKDAKSAVRWVRKNATILKINPQKIVASGASAGGHLAACTAMVTSFNEISDDLQVSPIPNAVVMYFPCVDTTVAPWFIKISKNQFELEQASPAHHIAGGLPPTIIFHGTKDQLIPTWTIKKFQEDMLAKQNICELQIFEGREHVLFKTDSQKIMELTEDFLIRMGFDI